MSFPVRRSPGLLPVLFLLFSVLAYPAMADDRDAAALAHLLGYIGVDYPATVAHGRVTNPVEYAEQHEFAGRAQALLRELPDAGEKAELLRQAEHLARLIEDKAPGEKVAALSARLREDLMRAYRVVVAPRAVPDAARGATLFAEHCAACHGMSGRADGPRARTLDPAPLDFHATARQEQRSVYALYSAISLGVPGTAMQAYAKQFSEDERWALALHVANFLATDTERQQGAALWTEQKYRTHFTSLASVTNVSPSQARSELGSAGPLVLAYLRSNPQAVSAREPPLVYSVRLLNESLAQYQAGTPEQAYATAVNAYLEGFELVEAGLMAVEPELKQAVEREMHAYRNLIKARAPITDVAAARDRIVPLLDKARMLLEGASLSPGVAYTSSLVILLREGLEAILLLAVVVAFLIKTGRREALKYIHVGWVVALLLGIATWAAATYVVSVSGASRELTEGITALLAAGILLYVGFWLHNKLQAQRWKAFIETKVHGALNNGTLWSIALVAFIAVYREVFETVLFYQTLWLQAGNGGQHMVLMGFLSAAAALVVLAWLIFRFSVRLPLRLFFAVNSVLLYVLAIVFAGKGVAALQGAGKLPVTAINFPAIDVLGVYPNLQALGLQLVLIASAAIFVAASRRKA
jgi:high-affinity iron transporter